MIKIATAECFTHGKVGREIHSIAQKYSGNFGPYYSKKILDYEKFIERTNTQDIEDLSIICSLFIPTIEGLEKILNIKAPKPNTIINGIKVYKEVEDLEVAELMAKAVKDKTNSDIGIGTTAGIGRGGIVIVTNNSSHTTTSDVYGDLRSSDSNILIKRQKSGIEKTLALLFYILNNEF